MKRFWMAGFAAVAVIAGTSAMAQDASPDGTMQKTTTTTTTTWSVRPDERTVIKDYVVKEKMRPEAVNGEIMVGGAVPAEVSLQPVPEEIYTKVPEAQRYEYFDDNGRIVFVDPDSRKIVQIVD